MRPALEERLVDIVPIDREDMDEAPQPAARCPLSTKIALGFCAVIMAAAGAATAATLLYRSSSATTQDDTCPVNNISGNVVLSHGNTTFYYTPTSDFPSPSMTTVAVLPCYLLLCASRFAIAQTNAFFKWTSTFIDEACSDPNLNLSGACRYYTKDRNYTLPTCNIPSANRSCTEFADELLRAEAHRRCKHGIFGERGRMVDSENDTMNGKPANFSKSGMMTADAWKLYVTDKTQPGMNAHHAKH